MCWQLLFILSVWSLLACAASAAPVRPPLLGVDNAGSGKTNNPGDPNLARALKELGVTFVVYHLNPVTDDGAKNAEMTRQRITATDSAMRAAGLRYTLNNETSNFVKTVELDPGVNEFAHSDGSHRWDLRPEWLPEATPVVLGHPGPETAFIGITYDECEHMQLTCNQFACYPDKNPLDAPFLVDTTGKDPEAAYNRLVQKCKWLRTRHYRGRAVLSTEQVWPDMFHIFARAGWTITPKILKENLSSVVMSISLGAALQYEDTGLQWWVSPDLWCKGNYPGHSPEALMSALLMGYWLGADALYVENLDFRVYGSPHPASDGKSSLISWREDGSYEVTPYGEIVKDFYTRYVPEHPLKHSWRDYRPRVVIIRLPDGDWGQSGTMFRDRLLGNADHPSDEISSEWLQVWPILTHGVARPGAISINNENVYPGYPWPFFVPIDSVAVFDHLVSGPVLDSVECFIVCGHALSERTFTEISKRVEQGATCIISRRLYDPKAAGVASSRETIAGRGGSCKGVWVVVDSFANPAVAAALKPFLGPSDVARFRFRGYTLDFRPQADRDCVTVTVSGRLIADAMQAHK